MTDTCRNCLAQEVCDITGASCKKMGALFTQHNRTLNGSNTMTNTAKNSATPKTVAEQAKASNDVTDAVINGESTEEVAEKVKKTIPAQTAESKTAQTEPKTGEDEKKLTLVQRLKSMSEKLKNNKKAMVAIGAAAVVAGVAFKNYRKAVSVEVLGPEDTTINGVGEAAQDDESTDSI